VSLRDRLEHPDDEVRLDAARAAAMSGDLGLVDVLIDLALHDTAEVRTTGGIAEVYEHVGDAAAGALGRILDRRAEDDPRVRATALDLDHDDERVATLLYYLGRRYEPLRRELEAHPHERVRLRAVNAVLSIQRTREFSDRLMTDPSPAIRIQALDVPKNVLDRDACLRLMRDDPAPEVRAAAAKTLAYTAVPAAPFVEAARVETHPAPRGALLSGFYYRMNDPAVVRAVIGYLGEESHIARRKAVDMLRAVPHPAAGAAIALRVLVEPDDWVFHQLLAYKFLLTHAPELRPLIERMHRHARTDGDRWRLSTALDVPPPTTPPAPVGDLDEAAMDAAAEAARDDPQWSALDPVHGPPVAARRAREHARLVQIFAARAVAAGVTPPPSGPLLRLIDDGEDLSAAGS
jgi:HEAT repeat protein